MNEKYEFPRVMKLRYDGPSRNVGFDFCPSSLSVEDLDERCVFMYEDEFVRTFARWLRQALEVGDSVTVTGNL